jgi:hypothetical protein
MSGTVATLNVAGTIRMETGTFSNALVNAYAQHQKEMVASALTSRSP